MPHTAAPLGQVRVLQVEDSEMDAELISMQLLDAGLQAEFLRVDSDEGLRRAIGEFRPDLVLSDLSMPGFSGYEALGIVREHALEVPFIFVSGTMGEDTAVQALQRGASDYILKDKTARLPAAAARAIREARSELERERVEKELLRSQRLDCLAMLAAGLSHDLRNILQPLLIVPDLLAIHSDSPKIKKLGDVIAECGRRGHEMAESMLSFVRGSRAARERIPVVSLFRAVQLLLQGSLPHSVRLQVEELPEGLVVHANYTELQQCLLNLCLNGIQAMPDGGTLTLAAEQVEMDQPGTGPVETGPVEYVRMRVSDTGIGMDEATKAQLFTPFFSTKSDGTGLGLMSCKRIVESYQGHIELHSEPGQGTTFELTLPVVQEADDTIDAAEGRGQRILVVDGDATRLSLVGNALSSQGYDPMLAHDGVMALHMLDAEIPALLIVDSEILLASAVSLLPALCDKGYVGPVIALEDPSRPTPQHELPEDISLQVLPKPLEMHQVFRAVEHALQASRA
ncbi:MAG: ATP-binding protein [Pseudoxanthomonas sp.]